MAKVIRQRRVGSMVTGSKVTGLALRGALHTAAEKQITAAGCVVGLGAVTFSGSKAFAQWKERSSDVVRQANGWNRYRGTASYNPAGIKTRNYRINYPAIAADAIFTRAEADLIAAYTLHETGHILYSCIEKHRVYTAVKNACGSDKNWRFLAELGERSGFSDTLQPIWNGIEDARMEHTVVRAGVAAGAANLFARLLNKLTNEIDASFNPCASGSYPFTLALLCRHALGNSNPYTASLLERIPEPKRTVFAETMQAMSGLKVGYDKDCEAWVLAARFYMAMGEINQQLLVDKVKLPPPDAGDPGEDGEDGDQPGNTGDQPPDGGNPGNPGPRPDGFGDMDDTDTDAQDGDFEDRATNPDAPKAPPEPPSSPTPDFLNEDDGEEGSEAGEGDDAGEAGDADGSGPAAKDDGEQSPGDDELTPGSGDGAGSGGMFNESTEMGVPVAVEPSVDDIFERANQRGNAPDDPDLRQFDRADIDKSLARTLINKFRSDNPW